MTQLADGSVQIGEEVMKPYTPGWCAYQLGVAQSMMERMLTGRDKNLPKGYYKKRMREFVDLIESSRTLSSAAKKESTPKKWVCPKCDTEYNHLPTTDGHAWCISCGNENLEVKE